MTSGGGGGGGGGDSYYGQGREGYCIPTEVVSEVFNQVDPNCSFEPGKKYKRVRLEGPVSQHQITDWGRKFGCVLVGSCYNTNLGNLANVHHEAGFRGLMYWMRTNDMPGTEAKMINTFNPAHTSPAEVSVSQGHRGCVYIIVGEKEAVEPSLGMSKQARKALARRLGLRGAGITNVQLMEQAKAQGVNVAPYIDQGSGAPAQANASGGGNSMLGE